MKTIICDIDGTIFKYPPNGSAQIVQEASLIDSGIPFDMLIMGCPDAGRVLINDINYQGKIKAHAANLERDAGLSSFNWEEVGL